jgi:OOP family OmpA-OmpF porin
MQSFKRGFVLFCSLLFLVLAGNVSGAQMTPKVDNFFFLYDGSGSMRGDYQALNERKAVLAKEAMQTMNGEIPGLDYTAGLFTVTPGFMANLPMTDFPNPAYGDAIANLPVPSSMYGIQTPLASGMQNLDSVLGGLTGPTAAILFSDGGENQGGQPGQVARELASRHDVCFHVVSFAQDADQKAVLQNIVDSQDCSTMITAETFQDEAARSDFIRNIFYTAAMDSDGDGVVDAQDLCPNTPANAQVDADGCALDSDGDGVADYKDQCPSTPEGAEVDSVGCALDSDGDGVADYKDQCPGTAEGLAVNEVGCPAETCINLQVRFEFNKAEIQTEYTDHLEEVAKFLMRYPETKMVVEGHTDSVGSMEYNEDLSQRRAESVKQFMVEEYGIRDNRLKAVGYGESRPIASNGTPEGRQKNRRVVGVLCTTFDEY